VKSDKENNNLYSAAEIQRYLRGEMSAEEMHAIETAALDDPFLADAIEGYEKAMKEEQEQVMQSELRRLDKEFRQRLKKPARVVPFTRSRWWQIAAAGVAILIIGISIYNNRIVQDQDAEPKLAVAEKKKKDTLASQTPEPERSTRPFAVADSQTKTEKKRIAPSQPSQGPDVANSSLPVERGDQSGNELSKGKAAGLVIKDADRDDLKSERYEPATRRQAAAETPVSAREGEYNSSPTKVPDSVDAKSSTLINQLNHFSGRVVDPENKPLAYATLQVMPGRINVVTDQAGNFSFSAKDSVVDVRVGMTGFEQRNFRLQNSMASNNLVLEPGNQNLDEVVVSGYGNKRKKEASEITGKVQNAIPGIGWIEYEKYIEANKKTPVNNPLLKGEVVVSFEVKKTSVLADFKIEKSLSKDHDKEVIRLIQEGPGWKLLSNKKTRITVIVKF
jgi:CarboxypepD_reg-like domain